jgi:hypothetical protein
MAEFNRGLAPSALEKLSRIAKGASAHWWKDLLSLWRPSGIDAGQNGLRLAIRHNYMNFYSRGQSIGRITFPPGVEPCLRTHVKYVRPDRLDQTYAKLIERTVTLDAKETEPYAGVETLGTWVQRAAGYSSVEKEHVDWVVGDNGTIVDLEMGLPADPGQKSANRIDCVALESESSGAAKLVFWEVKLFENGDLRAKEAPDLTKEDTGPRIRKQLMNYRTYLHDAQKRENVAKAYQSVCKLLVGMRDMAQVSPKLHPVVVEVAEGRRLIVDPEPRVLIVGPSKKRNWALHRDRLTKDLGFHVVEMAGRPYHLPGTRV